MAETVAVCSTCRKPILLGSRLIRCTVTACNAGRMKLVFCSPACWDEHLPTAHGYGDSKGLFAARKAVAQYAGRKNIADVDVDDVYLGNGVSELITMSLQALLDNGLGF